ncbi:MAG: nucleotidyltransferase family protein [Pseudomonadota bacterium]
MTNMHVDRAMLLAAGLGTRLRPLTLDTPKPLLPFDGTILIDHQLRYLARSGIKSVAINLHHLGEKIREHVGNGARFGLEIFYSEEPQILGTGGGIKKAARFFGRNPFVVLNADALIAADIRALAKAHFSRGVQVTMAVKRLDDGDDFTPIDVSDDGFIKGFGSGSYFYTGLQILSPDIFDALPASGIPACLIKDGYMRLLELGGKIGSFEYEGYFNDLGTPKRYEAAKEAIKAGEFKMYT